MIDFHNHILPNVDDGSKSIEMTLDMFRAAKLQGITDVVNTVHFQHPKMENKNVEYDFIKNEIKSCENYKILYGGSVNPTNSKEILNIENVDGVLVGGASLDVEKFNKILSL